MAKLTAVEVKEVYEEMAAALEVVKALPAGDPKKQLKLACYGEAVANAQRALQSVVEAEFMGLLASFNKTGHTYEFMQAVFNLYSKHFL